MFNRDEKKTCRCSHSNNNSYNWSPSELERLQYFLLKQQEQELYEYEQLASFENFLSPPATVSSSLSTSISCNSAPPYATGCSSPVVSDDFNPHFGSLDSFSQSNFNYHNIRNNSADNFHFRTQNSFYNERSTDYSADDVHKVVKYNRDATKRRFVSNKVFVGGISHSMNREIINHFFARYGAVFIDWPMKNKTHHSHSEKSTISSYSYLFLVYTNEQSVINLMRDCDQTQSGFFVSIPVCRDPIQIRPWFIQNAFYIAEKAKDAKIVDIHRTVFVGGLPRIVTAKEIAEIFSQFGKVLVVTIDIDQDYAYPKGAARVTFERDSAFRLALKTKILKFENIDSSKTTIEIKPYIMEDVGCDQCGGLWFNPFVDLYEQLSAASKQAFIRQQEKQKEKENQISSDFNMWTSYHPLLALNTNNKTSNHEPEGEDLLSKIDGMERNQFQQYVERFLPENRDETIMEKEVEAGARKFLKLTKSMGLDKPKTFNVDGVDYAVGPDLWDKFFPPPKYDLGSEPVQMEQDQKIQSFLRMKGAVVYSNKSVYCKEEPCRQYYCPSCSNKIHSGPDQHVLPPIGRPERRPRKDKNMYLVKPNT
uniref:RRM domain-containing protein n=1 Tax=Caenorhabditis tropicalis TaxID=1561998 RepID=A0A1I7UFG0_9PELO